MIDKVEGNLFIARLSTAQFLREDECNVFANTNIFIHVIKASIARNEASDFLSILDQLNADTFTDSRVGLFSLETSAFN